MKTTKLAAGALIEAQCTCSPEASNHTVVAVPGEQVAEVPPLAGAAPKKVAAPRTKKKDPGAADRAEWAALQPTVEPARAIPYDMNGKYRAKRLLMHPVFGLGIVQVVLPPNKIEVLFQDGKKLLRCG
jgi:hypothetical protein